MSNSRKVAMADVSPSTRMGGKDWALLTPGSVGSTSGFLGTMSFAPGEFVTLHLHAYSDEAIYVTRGTLDVQIDGVNHSVGENEAVFVPRGAHHRFENNGDSEVFAVYHIGPLAPSPHLGHQDLEPVPSPADRPPAVGG
jgi:putative monooxygenase